MSRWWKDLIMENSPLSNITDDIDLSKGIVLKKRQYDAFYKTGLKEILISENIEQCVITGVMTHLCCETTARSAFVNGFEVFFTVDGTATYNDNFHKASILNLAHGFAEPVEVKNLLKGFIQKNEK
jgi:isochorismate hydrolase